MSRCIACDALMTDDDFRYDYDMCQKCLKTIQPIPNTLKNKADQLIEGIEIKEEWFKGYDAYDEDGGELGWVTHAKQKNINKKEYEKLEKEMKKKYNKYNPRNDVEL